MKNIEVKPIDRLNGNIEYGILFDNVIKIQFFKLDNKFCKTFILQSVSEILSDNNYFPSLSKPEFEQTMKLTENILN